MPVMSWEMIWFSTLVAFVTLCAFQLLDTVFLYCLTLTVAKPQEGRPKKHRCRGNKCDGRAFVLLETSESSRIHCPIHPDPDGMCEIAQYLKRNVKDLHRYLDMLNRDTSEGSNNSWTSIMAGEVESSSSISLSLLREDPHSCTMVREASSSAAKTEVHCRGTETPITHHKGQDTLEGHMPATKLKQELGLPGDVYESPQDVPASAPPTPQPPEERDVIVVPIVQDLPFLDEAVKRQLERHIVKMKIERRYGRPTKVVEYEKIFEDNAPGQKASQAPPP